MRKSKGHICWLEGGFEAYEQGGEVYVARTSNAFDLNGYRHGRWECSRSHFERFRHLYREQDNEKEQGR